VERPISAVRLKYLKAGKVFDFKNQNMNARANLYGESLNLSIHNFILHFVIGWFVETMKLLYVTLKMSRG
jgi:hypothetical protein